MKRFALCILTFIIASGVLCLSSCGNDNDVGSTPEEENSLSSNVDQSPEVSPNDQDSISDKKYITSDSIDVVFDLENSTMIITEDTPKAPLIRKIVFEDDVIKETSKFEDEDTTSNIEYRYSKNGDKITEFSSDNSNAKFEYDEENRISKITYSESETTFVYSFSYSESGVMTITFDSKEDMKLYGHEKFWGIISEKKIDSVVVENNELLVNANGSEKTYAVDEVSDEEFKMFSMWNLIDFTLELHTTFDRGFILED